MPADALLSETEKREIWHLRSEGRRLLGDCARLCGALSRS